MLVRRCKLASELPCPFSRADNDSISASLQTQRLGHQRLLSVSPCASSIILHSNRTGANPCTGSDGMECHFECENGYIKLGRHVCQTYQLAAVLVPSGQDPVIIGNTFFGGSCERLCSAVSCVGGQVPIRNKASDANGPCLKTRCLSNDDALKNLARGNYEVWRLARDDSTGIYRSMVDLVYGSPPYDFLGSTADTGIGLSIECIAHALGFVETSVVQNRVLQTLRAYDGQIPGFKADRTPLGWFPVFENSKTGKAAAAAIFSPISTGWWALGLLFTKRYFEWATPDAILTPQISAIVEKLVLSVKWESILCNTAGAIDPIATGIAVQFFNDSVTCKTIPNREAEGPLSDGYYEWNGEYMPQIGLAYSTVCGAFAEGQCPNRAIEKMWEAFNGRRFFPNHAYAGHELLTTAAAYHIQLPFYLMYEFNGDVEYNKLFHSQWLADMAVYHSAAYNAGNRGRYGVGAGPTDKWCQKSCTSTLNPPWCYSMDWLTDAPGWQFCRTYSPYHVVGYLPAAPDIIKAQILDLLADGDAVLPVTEHGGQNEYYVLWRKSLVDPFFVQGYGVTMVDFAAESYGIATLWLGTDFFNIMTDHAKHEDDNTTQHNDTLPQNITVAYSTQTTVQPTTPTTTTTMQTVRQSTTQYITQEMSRTMSQTTTQNAEQSTTHQSTTQTTTRYRLQTSVQATNQPSTQTTTQSINQTLTQKTMQKTTQAMTITTTQVATQTTTTDFSFNWDQGRTLYIQEGAVSASPKSTSSAGTFLLVGVAMVVFVEALLHIMP